RLQAGPFTSFTAPALGSVWIADQYFFWQSTYPSAGRYYVHGDIAHQDGGGAAAHVDTPHNDSAHADTHTDSTHGDQHSDAPHDDYHNDHSDMVPHSDAGHGDVPYYQFHADASFVPGHSDGWQTFNDGSGPPHTDFHFDHSDQGVG